MKVTVITPTYNRAKLLPETIESVLAQDFDDFEYLILDDGSIDDTRHVIEHFLDDPRVKYYYHENAGEAETVNWGWSLANGEYFTQVNSDDPVYPHFLKTMVSALDEHPDAVLAYPDFHFINDRGEIISTTKGRNWDFLRNLSEFSCEAACPGSMIRRSSFSDLLNLKRRGFLHINDVEMYWNLALRGNFLHVPHVLATWRSHAGQISFDRYKCIPECEEWFSNYFSHPSLPDNVVAIKDDVRKSLCSYYIHLVESSPLCSCEKRKLSLPYRLELGELSYEFRCLQVGDNDLVGNKFNGHDLHVYLMKRNIFASHAVCDKKSCDPNTILISSNTGDAYSQELICSREFIEADVVHFHLMHNTPFNITDIHFISSLKPIVWTLHDPWFFGGHCVYPGGCDKWMSLCCDCEFLDSHFAMDRDMSAYEFYKKYISIQCAHIHVIVASKWMFERAVSSPIWKGKKIHYVPFGVDQERFKPQSASIARKVLGIRQTQCVLFARTQRNHKGLEVLLSALNQVAKYLSFTLLTVGENGLLGELPSSVQLYEYGWVDDDTLITLYQACDLFLMPSEHEAFGMMAIEAMSCGKMVLALDVQTSSLPEVINAPHCGVAVSREDYGTELLRLLHSPDEILWRGKSSLQYAQSEYGHVRYVSRIIAAYREVMNDYKPNENVQIVLQQLEKYSSYNNVQDSSDSIFNSCKCEDLGTAISSNGNLGRLVRYFQCHGAKRTFVKIVDVVFRRLRGWLSK